VSSGPVGKKNRCGRGKLGEGEPPPSEWSWTVRKKMSEKKSRQRGRKKKKQFTKKTLELQGVAVRGRAGRPLAKKKSKGN